MQFQQSYGASGDQSRKVAAGATGRLRELLGRARHHPPGRRRPGRQGLERQPVQGNPVRLGRHHRGPQGQPQGHQGLGRPAQAGRRGGHPQPVQLGQRQVEPARPVCRQERRRQGRQGGPRLHREARDRPRQGAAEVGSRGDRDVPAGHRRRAAELRERGAVRRAQRRPGRARHAADHVQDREPHRGADQEQEPRQGQGVQRLPVHAGGPEAVGRRPASARSTRRWPRSSRPTSRSRPSSGRSTTSAAGRPSTGTLFKKETGSIAVIYDKATS